MRTLQAGPISAGYENGFLRRITYGETEVLRMIYFALRDHNWNTLPSQIENEDLDISDDGFTITYDCAHLDGGVTVMEWKGKIEGKSDGTIVFEIAGTARENFRKNRAGFCVLHPLNITGVECTITHPDNSKSVLRFPTQVMPDNPFKNIQSMEWASSGDRYSLTFEGDIFETEDQRNWCDASFKTFCTPLDKPFPVELKQGQKVFQRVTYKPQAQLPRAQGRDRYVSLAESAQNAVVPFIGIGASTEALEMPDKAAGMIKALNLRHYRVEIYPSKDHWVADFSRACETGFNLALPLEAVLHLSDAYRDEIESFVVLCLQNRVKLRKVLLLDNTRLVTSEKIIAEVSRLKHSFPKVPVGAGTNYNFNEVNKNRFQAGDLDYVSFSMDPQEHASDDLTILENTEAQEHLVRSAKAIYGEGVQVHASPVALRKRFNPYATNPEDLFISESAKADPRQREMFAGIWTFGSVCSLAKGGASAVTYYQTIGNQGILSIEGDPYPVYEMLRNFAPFQGKPAKVLDSNDQLSVQGVVLDRKTLGLVNLTQTEQVVRFAGAEYRLRPREVKFEPLYRTQ